jgi:hypothetical protein
MNRYIVLIFCLFFSNLLLAQKHTIFGNILDQESGEHLIGATISVKDLNIGTFSNNYGFYSLTIPQGVCNISYSYVGYKTTSFQINLATDTSMDIRLIPDITALDEVVVNAEDKNYISSTQMGSQQLNIKAARLTPAPVGEIDLIKNLQLLPGVQAAGEGTTNLNVRGGSFDQNLFLLDDAPVYNPSHALGFFSTFNPDAISSVKIYKAAFPAQYGGRLSSVVDVRMKEGNNQSFNGTASVGLIASRLSIEAPIKKDKASFIISGRYSYAGFTYNMLGSLGQTLGLQSFKNFNDNNEINFYDFNVKFNYKLKKDHLYFSMYAGSDHFYCSTVDNNSSMDWGNKAGTIRWNHVFNSRLFSNTMLVYSKYDYSYSLLDDARNFIWSSDLQEIDLKSDFDYFINPLNHLSFGITLEKHKYFPGRIGPHDSTSLTIPFELDRQKTLENALYVSNEQKINEIFSLSYGLRYSTSFLLGESTVYSYSPSGSVIDSTYYGKGELVNYYGGLEPRLDLRYLINKNNSIKASYTYVKQYQHLISNSSVGLPTDVWLPANKLIKPQYSNQFAIGYYKSFTDNKYDFYTEIYYRRMGDVIDYKDNADLFLNPHIETQLLSGKGQSYGAEFYLEKKTGKVTGWISYTLSKTTKQINGINNNEPYPATFDRRHNLSLVFMYKLSPSWDFASTFKFTSGGYITMPEGSFNYYGSSFNYYSSRNGYKLPPYHRLDISFTYRNIKKQYNNWKPELSFGIYNVYGQKNIFSLFVKQVEGDFNSTTAYKMYLYGLTPFITYSIKF